MRSARRVLDCTVLSVTAVVLDYQLDWAILPCFSCKVIDTLWNLPDATFLASHSLDTEAQNGPGTLAYG